MTVKDYWSATEGIFNCLIDRSRTVAFGSAIRKTVRPGDVVVDMGSGSGVLALMAAKAGAERVYAIEDDERCIDALATTFARNGFDDRIEVIKGDVTSIRLPEAVDVVIGEMVATGLIEERQIPAMNNMLRFTRPTSRVLVSAINNYLDLVYCPDEFYGFRFFVTRYEYPGEPELASLPRDVPPRLSSAEV